MSTKTTSRRRNPAGEVALLKVRDPKLLVLLRERAGLSQRELARKLDTSYGHYADLEGGRRQPSYALGCKLAELHEVRLDALFDEIPLEYGEPDTESNAS